MNDHQPSTEQPPAVPSERLAVPSDLFEKETKSGLIQPTQLTDSVATGISLQPGFQFGPYTIAKKLGEGGMGAVFLAKHNRLDKLVAIKVLPAEMTNQSVIVARFDREMRAVGKLDHPNIIRAMDAGEVNGVHYLAMEYVDGLTLHSLIRDQKPLPVADACFLIQQAALALGAAHKAGLIHRDVKPGNLMISKEGVVKLVDLGLALLHGDPVARTERTDLTSTGITATGQAFGTPDYMAPEQWDDAHAADPRADLYALGCTLYFLLTGQVPFGGDQYKSSVAKMKGHVMGTVPNLTDHRPDVPFELNLIFRRLLAKSPKDRLQTAQELIQALEPYAVKAARDGSRWQIPKTIDPSTKTLTQPSADVERLKVKRTGLTVLQRLTRVVVGAVILAGLFAIFINWPKPPRTMPLSGADRAAASEGSPARPTVDVAELAAKSTSATTDASRATSSPAGVTNALATFEPARERRAAEIVLSFPGASAAWHKVDPANNSKRIAQGWLQREMLHEDFRIDHINLANSSVTAAQIAELITLCSSLESLVLIGCESCTDEAMAQLPRSSSLRLLHVRGSGSAHLHKSLHWLSQFPHLVNLAIEGNAVEGILDTLPQMPHLQGLSSPIGAHVVGVHGLEQLAIKCPKLETYALSDWSCETLMPLAKLNELRELRLPRDYINERYMAELATFPKLNSLNIWFEGGCDYSSLKLLDHKLQRLWLDGQWQGLKNFSEWEPVTRLEKLEQLEVGGYVTVDQQVLTALARMPALKKLIIDTTADPATFRQYLPADLEALKVARPDIEVIDNSNATANITLAPPSLQTLPFDPARERRAAELILSIPGAVASWRKTDPKNSLLTTSATLIERELPDHDFVIDHIDLSASDVTVSQVTELILLCQSLENLSLNSCQHITDESASQLPPSSTLKKLSISSTKVGQSDLRWIEKFPRLNELRMEVPLAAGVMDTFPNLPVLERFHSPTSGLGPTGLATLARQCPQLEVLYLGDSSLTTLQPLSVCSQLRKLHLSTNYFDERFVAELATFDKLNTLWLWVTPGADLALLGQLDHKIRKLTLEVSSGDAIKTFAEWEPATRLEKLNQLKIGGLVAVDQHALMALARMPSLKRLVFHPTADHAAFRQFIATDLEALKAARPDLLIFDNSDAAVNTPYGFDDDTFVQQFSLARERRAAELLRTIQGAKAVCAFPTGGGFNLIGNPPEADFYIKSLDLREAQFTTDLLVEVLSNCRGLKKLNLSGCEQVTDEVLNRLPEQPAVVELLLFGTATTQHDLDWLRKFPQLKQLELVTFQSSPNIIATFPPMPRLVDLRTMSTPNSIGTGGLKFLAKQCPNLETLSVNDWAIDSLANLKHFPKLRNLALSGNLLTEKHIQDMRDLSALRKLMFWYVHENSLEPILQLDGKLTELHINDPDGKLGEFARWEPVTRMRNLEVLTLGKQVLVNRPALEALAQMPKLKQLILEASPNPDQYRQYSPSEFDEFKAQRPELTIYRIGID